MKKDFGKTKEAIANQENEFPLTLNFLNVTEAGAIAAAHTAGFGDKVNSDLQAVNAMSVIFEKIDFRGKVVIGEGYRDDAPKFWIGQPLGRKKSKGPKMHIAIDPLENTNSTAVGKSGAVSVFAVSEEGGLFNAPDMYMEKLIVGAQAAGKVSLDFSVNKNLEIIANELKRDVSDLNVTVLQRDRNEKLIEEIRQAGARVRLIDDGDLMPGIAVCMGGSGIHAVMGIGAAPEGVITAAGIKCLRGEMQCRFWVRNEDERKILKDMKVIEEKIYTQDDLASGKNIIFCASAVTDILELKLSGVRFIAEGAKVESLVMTSNPGNIRFVKTTKVYDKDKLEFSL